MTTSLFRTYVFVLSSAFLMRAWNRQWLHYRKGLITEFSFSDQSTTLASPQVRSSTHLRKVAPHAIMQSSEGGSETSSLHPVPVSLVERLLHVIGMRQVIYHSVTEQRDGRNHKGCDYHAVQRAALTVDLKDQLHVLTSFQV